MTSPYQAGRLSHISREAPELRLSRLTGLTVCASMYMYVVVVVVMVVVVAAVVVVVS
jgi:hypothetical protein